jgi:hypothetical protein
VFYEPEAGSMDESTWEFQDPIRQLTRHAVITDLVCHPS